MELYGLTFTVYTVSITINYGIRYDVSGFSNGYILEVKAEGCRMQDDEQHSIQH